LGGKAQLGSRSIKDHILGLEEDISKDRETNVTVILDTAKADIGVGGGDLTIIKVRSGDGGGVRSDLEDEVGKSSRAREDLSTHG
jgi:hypothetical protein